jgi:hypothetical protein
MDPMLANLKRVAQHLAGSLAPEMSTSTKSHKDQPLSETVESDLAGITLELAALRDIIQYLAARVEALESVGHPKRKVVKDDR